MFIRFVWILILLLLSAFLDFVSVVSSETWGERPLPIGDPKPQCILCTVLKVSGQHPNLITNFYQLDSFFFFNGSLNLFILRSKHDSRHNLLHGIPKNKIACNFYLYLQKQKQERENCRRVVVVRVPKSTTDSLILPIKYSQDLSERIKSFMKLFAIVVHACYFWLRWSRG